MSSSNTNTSSTDSGTEKKYPASHSCSCERCCCHKTVPSSGQICGNCADTCQKFLLISGGLTPVYDDKEGGAKKGRSGLSSS